MSRAVAALLVAAVVVAGVWVTGGLLTEDATVAMLLTGVWFAVSGLAAFLLARRWRPLAIPVLASWLVTSAAVGGVLLWTSTVDKVVDEDVVTAPGASGSGANPTPNPSMTRQGGVRPGPLVLATGDFRDRAHPTEGIATFLEKTDGSRVLTLTRFDTDPGRTCGSTSSRATARRSTAPSISAPSRATRVTSSTTCRGTRPTVP